MRIVDRDRKRARGHKKEKSHSLLHVEDQLMLNIQGCCMFRQLLLFGNRNTNNLISQQSMNNSVTSNAAPASNRNSFSIETILSKPIRLPQVPPLPSQFVPIVFNRTSNKINYLNKYCDENGYIDEMSHGAGGGGDGSGLDDGRSSERSPESSCCDDLIDDLGHADDDDHDNNNRRLF